MRTLRVVGITEDGSVVLEDSTRRERFTVPADEQLRAAARGDLTRLGQISIELESQLRPREIQARIRAGASVEQVASAAGVPVQKIERFAYPVLLERTRTADLARSAHPVRDDGPDVRTLTETVAHTFGLRGLDHLEADWDSWKGEDGRWVVALSWRSGRSDIHAHFTFQPGAHGGTVAALDDHARDLVEGRPQQPLRPVGPVIDMTRPDEPAPAPAAPETVRAAVNGDAPRIAPEQRRGGTAAARREAARSRNEARAEARTDARAEARTEARSELLPEAPARPPAHPATRSTDTRSTDTLSTDTAPARPPVVDAPDAPEEKPATRTEATPPRTPAAEAPAAPEEPAPTEPAVAEEPELPAEATPDAVPAETVRATQERDGEPAPQTPAAGAPAEESEATTPAAPKRTRKGKPVMPSWDEVLLGVRGR